MKEMEEDKRKCPNHDSSESCAKMLLPINDALELLSGKWKLQILLSLTFDKKRFKQIQREVVGVTPKMLSKELKELEQNDMVERKVYDTQPVSVEYQITAYGKTVLPLLHELHKWGTKHRKKIHAKASK
jgi:DNA-binding HxlR family transcriptional regulator